MYIEKLAGFKITVISSKIKKNKANANFKQITNSLYR